MSHEISEQPTEAATSEPRGADKKVDKQKQKRKKHSVRRGRNTPLILLCFSCVLCFTLSLLCTSLFTLIVILDQKVEALNSNLYDSNKFETVDMSQDPLSETTYRLPKDVKPLHYDVYLHPDLQQGTYQGKVTILIDVLHTRKYIALHQKDLKIISTKLKTYHREEDYEIKLLPISDIPKFEMFLVTAINDITSGLYELILEFEGALEPNKIVGFYSSKYKDENNETRSIATSKFEPTYARLGFPCFDEPSFKAEFTMKLVHPTGDCYSALSNMNVESTQVDEPSPGLTTVTFAKSVPMSTYLSCFIISDFVALKGNAKGLNGKVFPISVYTTRRQKSKGAFALDIGIKAIEYYIDLFQIDYPLPKLDMAAIPDFVSGAMENWGLVTYRETALLYDPKTSSTANKYSITLTITHELSHMWFGNLVTLSWWNDLWLNEGFATFMQYKCADSILPNWKLLDHYLTETLHPVLVSDAQLSSRPIVKVVGNSDQITEIFDEISYNKGSAVIRMMENFVGTENFYNGIVAYLKKFSYYNAQSSDLFDILQEAVGSKMDVTSIMDTWTRQMGYPVVKVQKTDQSTYTLTQKRFLTDPEAHYDPSESSFGYKWTIPLTYITEKNSTSTLTFFNKDSSELVIDTKEPTEWIKCNVDQIGYYRVNYDQENWENLTNVLRWYHKKLSTADRTNLLDDAFSLAFAGQSSYDIALNMTLYLPRETDVVPWAVASSQFEYIDTLLSSTDSSTKFKSYVRDLVDSVYHDVTWETSDNEEESTRRLRTTILDLACSMGHSECLDEAGNIFKAWIEDRKDIRPHPDIRALIYYYGMSHVGGETEWDTMFEKFTKESNNSEKLKLMRGLSGIRSTWILNKFITMAKDENYVRAQDFMNCLMMVSDNPVGAPLVWDWVRNNWDFMVNRYTLNNRYLGRLIPAITRSFATETKLEEMKNFFKKYPEAGAGVASRAKSLETISNNIKWLSKNKIQLDNWLKAHSKNH